MAGRRPLPTELKEAMGNPGKRALNANQPKPPRQRAFSCPRVLSKLARAEWRRMCRVLGPLVLITEADRAALAIYCEAWARWVDATEKVRLLGDVVKTKSGNAILNPYRTVANRAEETMLKAATEFGMTPSSRTRLNAMPPPPSTDPADDYFASEQRSGQPVLQ